MNSWQQTKTYWCRRCKAIYIHDQSYFHVLFKCPQRAGVTRTSMTDRGWGLEIKMTNPALCGGFSNPVC